MLALWEFFWTWTAASVPFTGTHTPARSGLARCATSRSGYYLGRLDQAFPAGSWVLSALPPRGPVSCRLARAGLARAGVTSSAYLAASVSGSEDLASTAWVIAVFPGRDYAPPRVARAGVARAGVAAANFVPTVSRIDLPSTSWVVVAP